MHSRVEAKWTSVLLAATTAVALGLSATAMGQQSGGKVIPLPAEDKALLDEFLGAGVVGKPVAGEPMADLMKFKPLVNSHWRFKMTSGAQKGEVVDHKFLALDRDPSGATWKVEIGKTDLLFLRKTASNDVEFVSHPELDTGLVTAYYPPAPVLVRGAKPGDSGQFKFDVKVYYLNEPGNIKHQGSLTLTLSYVGAYEVTVPAGKFEAALIKSDYEGKVGPAKVKDVQYRFFVKDLGVVAMVERKNVSAYLMYKDHTQIGKVLVDKPQPL